MGTMPSWSFLSNHGAVLLLVATVPQITATQIGAQLGITERPVRRIISELESAGTYENSRRQTLTNSQPLPGPVVRDLAVGDLLGILPSGQARRTD